MDKNAFVSEFETMIEMAELRILSKHSLENPLSDEQFKRMMELKKKLLEG